jgi:outer membrane lipase/esterase
MWPEFISTNLGIGYVPTNNYGRCGATSSDVSNQLSFSFRMPPKSALSLYFLWAGDADFLPALPPDGFGGVYIAWTNEVAWNQLIQKTIVNNSNAIDQLYLKGARQIVVPSLWDLSKSPESIRDFGTNTAGLSRLSEYIARCNAGLSDMMKVYSQTRPDLRIVSVDIFSNLNEVLENPAQYGFTKTTVEAINDPALGNKSFAGPGANYVFWDPLHGTS